MNRLAPLKDQYNRWRKNRAKGVTAEPLRSLSELAEEFGIDGRRLGRILADDATAPAPKLLVSSGPGKPKKWFSPSEMRRWWAARSAEQASQS